MPLPKAFTAEAEWADVKFVVPTSVHVDHLEARWREVRNKTLTIAYPLIGNFSLALDLGAYIGFWTVQLAHMFAAVAAFEPSPKIRDMCQHNTKNYPNVKVIPCALGDRQGPLLMHSPNSALMARSVHCFEEPDGWPVFVAHMQTLDSFDFAPGLIKSNCDGMDSLVLLGARETITKHRPVLIVEDKPELTKKAGSPELGPVLTSLNYTERARVESLIIATHD